MLDEVLFLIYFSYLCYTLLYVYYIFIRVLCFLILLYSSTFTLFDFKFV